MTPDSTAGQLATFQPLHKSLWPDLPAPTPPEPPRRFLEHFEPGRRSGIANLFHYGARAGASTPRALCSHVWQTVQRRQQQAQDPETAAHLSHALEVLHDDQPGALAYATDVLHYEQLPYEERQKVKAARAVHFLHEAMRGKAVTTPQLAMLRRLGYQGAVPTDRAEASALIDTLMQRRGER
jgi:hypothetical protein